MKAPTKDALRRQLLLEKAQNAQLLETIRRTQQLLLDFIWFTGFAAYHQPDFGSYRFTNNTDRQEMRKARRKRALVEHPEDIA